MGGFGGVSVVLKSVWMWEVCPAAVKGRGVERDEVIVI